MPDESPAQRVMRLFKRKPREPVLSAVRAQYPRGGIIGPANPKAAEDFGALLRSPFVRDTLSQMLPRGKRAFVHSHPGSEISNLQGSTHSLNPSRIRLNEQWRDQRNSESGEMEPTRFNESLLTHELMHSLDFRGYVPASVNRKLNNTLSEKGIIPNTLRGRKDWLEARAGAAEVAMSIFRGHRGNPERQYGSQELLNWLQTLIPSPEGRNQGPQAP